MRIRITARFIGMVIVSTIILMILSFVVLTFQENSYNDGAPNDPGSITLNFSTNIQQDNNGDISITEEGQQLLEEENAWLQVLDLNGNAIYGLNEPPNALEHYSPADIVHTNMYSDTIFGYTVYVASIHNNENIDYLIGFPSSEADKFIVNYNNQQILQFFVIMLVLSTLVFLIMGIIFGNRIAKPVSQIIEGVERLANNNFNQQYKEKGLYRSVFSSLNRLTNTLKSSLIERQKTKEQRETWISNMSHDLKTPLSVIKGYSEVLADPAYESSKDEIRSYSSTILEKSIYMENMIEELRLNEKLMHNGVQLDKKKENITRLIKNIVIDILNHPDYSGKDIDFHSDDKDLNLFFDENLMRRSIENLIYNAIVHNDSQTKVKIKISEVDEHVLIEINDDGRGMNVEDLDKLFNRYYRGTNTKDYKGSGLGMSIAKEVIEAHGGEIKVRSEVNKGTQIKIKL